MFISSNGTPSSKPDPDLDAIQAWYTAGYLEGLIAGYTNTEPFKMDEVVLQPESFVPMIEGLDSAQQRELIDMLNSIDAAALGSGPGEWQRRRMAKLWGYLRTIQL